MGWFRNLASGGALIGGALAAVYFAGPALGSGPVARIELRATPVLLNRADPAASRVGRLLFVGGLELSSADQRFGGISALMWEPGCDRLLAVTDSGNWLILDPSEEGGRLTGIRAAWLSPLLSPDGRPPRSKRDADAESLARAADGTTFVFYELDHRGEAYPDVSACRPESLAQPAARRWVPPDVSNWPANGGIESAARLGNELLMLSEASPGAAGGRAGVVAAPDSAEGRRFSYAAPTGHEPTALDPLDPAGRMLVLHRRFTPLTGISIIMSEADFPSTLPERAMPREIARLAPPLSVDNFEGLAVRAEGTRRFVYLVSDDNFNPLQRTLLLKFELLPDRMPADPQ